MVSAAAPVHVSRLELRHRALGLQRRRFWRELTYGAILVVADILTLAAVFALLGMLPLDALIPSLGEGGESFVRGLIPQTPIALARRVTSLLFVLFVTRCYAHTERQQHPARIAAALLLGLALPRWVEIWTTHLPARWLLLGLVLAVTWGALVVQRRGFASALRAIDPRRLDPARTLIVGPADDVQRVTSWRAERSGGPPLPTLVLSDTWPHGTAESMRELYDALAESDGDAIVVVGALSDAALQAVMIAASSAGVSVYATRRSAFRGLDEPSFVLRRAEPLSVLSRPALVGWQLVLKRVVDVSGALVAMLVLSPLLLLVALAVRLTSHGPALFRQIRVGLGGDPFVMFKFRTMVHDAEVRQAALQEANVYSDEPIFKLANDPRTTPIGVFLRRSSLDELPQLINVLRGEMSLVGPRPALPSEALRYQQHHFVRFEVLPGMTGPWQVSGRNAISNFEDVVKLETRYIKGWTVWRDFLILLRTVPAVLSMKGAF
ncbi:MAG TPA: exopolysaccharide biosynthesis polyprenyl glycosylphosphotransferase [Gemmatimonadaceae bacterium]|nr:exopolysaccharide biosynthesis polyprenyl glycosylphosphotransferase [Gemmatimonadaceae bacterium]